MYLWIMLGKTIVESVNCYRYEVLILKREEQRELLALKMNYLEVS